MAGQLPPPKTFTDWIPLITAAKAGVELFRIRAILAQRRAHAPAHRHDHRRATSKPCPNLLPEVWDATPLRVVSFLEMTGIRAGATRRKFSREAVEKIDSLTHPRCRAALSPHAPYSTRRNCSGSPPKPRANANCASPRTSPNPSRNLKCSRTARGEMFDWLAAQRPRHVRLRPRFARRGISSATACSAKISSPSTSTVSRAATPRLLGKHEFTSSIARAATIISSIRHFLRERLAAPASTSASAPTASPPSAKAETRTSN